ncbi:hypothetical protein [Legionella sp. km772]|uniref:hypothetical protein n=1 Tax=Legionella sp. km772 TaxID=2498111 RepID=UPI000FA84617|nr:hypothetical protein [Legionella sp. km772]RUR12719.1 hypothetical protein ELY15_04310 [Legionella sp. km772]
MPNERQLINKSIYNELTSLNKEQVKLAAEQIDVRASEGVMQEEARALPQFFKPAVGIYARLLAKHPTFASSTTAKAAEDEAIKEIIAAIKQRLANSKDRLNHDKLVGLEAAQEAIDKPSKRYRREYQSHGHSAWDDIGRLHSALRLLLNDATINPASTWKTPYFNGSSSYKGKTYRHYLALIWKGATEDNIEAPINFSGIPSEQLKEGAIEQIITALAQCRREHNYDGSTPDWEQTKKPSDAQRCDMGLRGDLFGQMLIHNEHYMQTRTKLNIELIEPLIKDLLFAEFTQLAIEAKEKIIHYLENKAIILVDPEAEEVEALNKFIRDTKLIALEKLLAKIASSENPALAKIHSFLTKIKEKAGRGDVDAIRGLSQIMTDLDRWVKLEAESLLMTERTNSASMDYIRRFANEGISQVFHSQLKAALEGDIEARSQMLSQRDELVNKLEALQYRLDNLLIQTIVFPQASLSSLKKGEYRQLITHYEGKILALETQIKSMIAAYLEQQGIVLAQQFPLLADTGVASTIELRKKSFIEQQKQVLVDLEKMKTKLARLQLLINNDSVDAANLRPHAQMLLAAYPDEQKYSPDFYAAYLWNLLLEKTPSEHYIIENSDHKEFSHTLDLLFGNATAGIPGLETVQQHLIMYAFNVQRKKHIEQGKKELSIVNRWKLVEEYLAKKGIRLGEADKVPNDHLITAYETAYQASKLPSKIWLTIVERSGQQKALEDMLKIPNEEARALKRKESRYAEQMLAAATHLPLSLYGEVDAEKQEAALTTWKAVAQSIFVNYPRTSRQHIDALINFLVQTLMVQLEIKQFAKEDKEVLEQIVKKYMGIENFSGFPLPFTPSPPTTENQIACLAQHLTLMLTTLSPAAIKTSFEQGIIRLMAREKASSIVTGSDKYLIRLSNFEPYKLVITTKEANTYISSAAKQTVNVAGQSYSISTYPDSALHTAAEPHIKHKKAIVPDLTLEQMTSVVFQRQQAEIYQSIYSDVNFYERDNTRLEAPLTHGLFRPAPPIGLRRAIAKVDSHLRADIRPG